MSKFGLFGAILGGLAVTAAGPAAAQDAASAGDGMGEVVVTAQKRAQALQDVPLAVSAFNQAFLEEQRVDDVVDLLKFAPGFTGTSIGANVPIIPVRGLNGNDFGIGGDATLGIYIDDVFAGRKTASVQDLMDVARVEFVRGPQSTLFGRNSTAGAISITTNRPSDEAFEGNVSATIAEFNHYEAEGVVNIPLGDGAAMRVAGLYRTLDGYSDNLIGSNSFSEDETYGGRIAFQFEPSEDLTVLLQADGTKREGTIPPYRSTIIFAPGQSTDPFDDVAQDLPDARNQDDREAWNASGHVTWEITPNLTLNSITAFRTYNVNFGSDDDGSYLPGLSTFQFEDGNQYSQEFRLNGENGPLNWFLGASVLKEDVRVGFSAEYDILLLFTGTPGLMVEETGFGSVDNTGWAIYGDATLAVTDRLNLTAGLRYSHDEKDFQINIPLNATAAGFLGENAFFFPNSGGVTQRQETSDNALLPRFVVDYHINDDLMVYANASKGFRAGGFNTFAFDEGYDPESVWSYEVGFKAEMADGRVTLNADVFHYEYEDLQVLVPVGAAFLVRNAADAEGRGLEVQLSARPVEELNIYAGLMLLDAEYGTFVSGTADYSGNRLTRAPEVAGNIGARWQQPISDSLEGFVGVDFTYQSEQFLHPSNDDFRRLAPVGLVDAQFGVTTRDERWSFTVFATNLFDREYFINRGGLGYPFYPNEIAAPPRTIGLEISSKF